MNVLRPSARSWLRLILLHETETHDQRGRRALAQILIDVQEIAQQGGDDACQRILARIEELARPVTVERLR